MPYTIGVAAEDCTSKVTGLEPGYMFNRRIRKAIYAILVGTRNLVILINTVYVSAIAL